MNKFLQRQELPQLAIKVTENLNSPMSFKEVEFVVKILTLKENSLTSFLNY